MRTRKPISSISYNSLDFLKMKLDELIRNHRISYYMFIRHFAEMDECAGKDHTHLYIEPNGQIDTMDIQDILREFDPEKPDKPLGCINFCNSKPDDWILYAQHFAPYLASKFQSREYMYEKSDFLFSDENTFNSMYYHAFKASEWSARNQILTALSDMSLSPVELINAGVVPLQQASQLNAYKYMQKNYGTLSRNGKENHEKKYLEYYTPDFDVTIDNICNCDIVDIADKDFFNSTD